MRTEKMILPDTNAIVTVRYCQCGDTERILQRGERCHGCEEWEARRREAVPQWDGNRHE